MFLDLVATFIHWRSLVGAMFRMNKRRKLHLLSKCRFIFIFFAPIIDTHLFILIFPKLYRIFIMVLVECNLGANYLNNRVAYRKISDELLVHYSSTENFSLKKWDFISRCCYQVDKSGQEILKFINAYFEKRTYESNPHDIWRTVTVCAGVYHMNGSFLAAERLERAGKLLADNISGRNPGHYQEACYFTAIGHISLVDYLVKGRQIGVLANAPETLLYFEPAIANKTFARAMARVAEESGIEVKEVDRLPQNTEYDLETYVLSSGNYATARRCYSEIQEKWDRASKPPLLLLPIEVESLGKKVAMKIGLPANAWFVGLHIREGKDVARANRNARFENYIKAIEHIASQGGWVIRLGSNSKCKFDRKYPSINNYIDSRTFDLQADELEALHCYVWAKSRFFIGNLSGGTNPPGTFGTPILWTDVHPISGFRSPSPKDITLPRPVMHISSTRYLTLFEIISDEYVQSQSENPDIVNSYGFQVLENSAEEIADAVIDMFKKESNMLSVEYADQIKITNEIFARIQLGYGSEFAPSFLKKYSNFLTLERFNDQLGAE